MGAGPGQLRDSSNGWLQQPLADMLKALPTKRLVILGEPGSGKTALAMLLTVRLAGHRQDLTPVMFSIASWEPSREYLHSWMARRIFEDYWFTAPTAGGRAQLAELIAEGRIIPILDGIDEMPEGARQIVLSAINRMHSTLPIVLTCRTLEFEEVIRDGGTALADAVIVEIEPVRPNDAADYLSATLVTDDERWMAILTHLRRPNVTPLVRALSTPLMISLTRAAYANPATRPAELLDPLRFSSPESIERHLLSSFVDAAYSPNPEPGARPPERQLHDYDARSASRWLSTLARHLENETTTDLAWWRVVRILPQYQLELASRLFVCVFATVAFGLSFWLGYGAEWIFAGVVMGLALSVVCSFVFGLTIWAPSDAKSLPSNLIRRALIWVIYPAIAGVLSGCSAALTEGPRNGLITGTTTALVFLILIQPTVSVMRRVGTWTLSWRRHAQIANGWTIEGSLRRLVTQLAYALVAATAISVVIGLSEVSTSGMTAGLIAFGDYFLTFGLMSVLLLGLGLIRKAAVPERVNIRLVGRLREGFRFLMLGLWLGCLYGILLIAIFLTVVGLSLRLAHLVFGELPDNRQPGYLLTVVSLSLVVGVACGLGAGVAGWLNAPVDLTTAPNPRSVLHRARVAAAAWMIVSAVIVGGSVLAATPWITRSGSVVGYGGGVVAVISILALTSNSWGELQVALGILASRGALPVRLLRFLDDAYKRGVLRQAGPFYRFRHRCLQESLAATDQEPSAIRIASGRSTDWPPTPRPRQSLDPTQDRPEVEQDPTVADLR